MLFFSGRRCCISTALAEKQRCYVFFHRSIKEDRPVFFSWNAARVPVYSLSCDMSFRGSGILWNGGSSGQEWLLSRRYPDDIRHRKLPAVTPKLPPNDRQVTRGNAFVFSKRKCRRLQRKLQNVAYHIS